MVPVVEPVRMIEPPAFISGSAFCTVNSVPFTFTVKTLSKLSSEILPRGSSAPSPALAKSTSIRPLADLTVSKSRSRSVRPPGLGC